MQSNLRSPKREILLHWRLNLQGPSARSEAMKETRLPIQPGDPEWTKLSRGSRWDPRYQERWILNKEGKKRCRLCGVIKGSSDFTPYKRNNGKGTVGGVMNECKDCMLVRSRDIWLRRKYGISQQQYDEMFQAQHYSCAICRLRASRLTQW